MSDDGQIKITTASVQTFISQLESLSSSITSDGSVKTLMGYADNDTVLRAGYHDSQEAAVGGLEDAFGKFASKMTTTVNSINSDVRQLRNNLAAVKQQFDITDDNATWTAQEVQTLFQGVGS